MVGQLHALVVKVEAAAHPTAVQAGVPGHLLQIVEDLVPVLVIEVLGSGGSIVEPELDGGTGELQEPLHVGHQVLGRVVLIQHAVHPEGHRQAGQQVVVGLYHILLHMAGDVDAGDLVLVLLGKRQDIVLGLMLGHRQGGVDIDLVGGGDFVQHGLQRRQIGKGFTAGEYEVTAGRDSVHAADALADLLQRKTRQVSVFTFIDTKRAVVLAVVRDEDRHRCAALPRLVGMFHS